MFASVLVRISTIVTFALALLHCSSSQSTVANVERSASCPAPGARVPYAQLLAQTRNYVGCDVETEVAFVGAGQGGLVGGSAARPGQSVFRVTPPGQSPSSGPLGMDFSFLTLPDGSAGTLFSATAGQRFVVRGAMEMQESQAGYESGNWGRTLRATSVAAAPAVAAP